MSPSQWNNLFRADKMKAHGKFPKAQQDIPIRSINKKTWNGNKMCRFYRKCHTHLHKVSICMSMYKKCRSLENITTMNMYHHLHFYTHSDANWVNRTLLKCRFIWISNCVHWHKNIHLSSYFLCVDPLSEWQNSP